MPIPARQGEVFVVRLADPAAGANWTWVAPDGYRYLISAVQYHYVTCATASNRRVTIYIRAGTPLNTFLQICAENDAVASKNYDFYWAAGPGTPYLNLTALKVVTPLPLECYLIPGEEIVSQIGGMVAADQISNPTIYGQRWVLES